MRKTGKFMLLAAGAFALTSMFGMSAAADDWRSDRDRSDRRDRYERRDDRDFLRGVVQRVDERRGVVFVREGRGGRPIAVQMTRRHQRGIDIGDLRRGDIVTFVGDWKRGGIFEARRIEDVDGGRRNRRRY